MTDVISAERIDPSALDQSKREELGRQLYEVHCTAFAGLDRAAFDRYVVNSPAQQTRLLLYRNRDRELIGYFGVHRFDMEVHGKPVVVFRAEVGLRPQYRQRDAILTLWWTEATRFKFLHPGKAVYFFFVPVNPSSYAMVARYIHESYPGRSHTVPPAVLGLMTHLASRFGLPPVQEDKPMVRKVGWITQATRQEQDYWRSSTNPYVRFYLDANPTFAEGHGLLTLVPVTFANTLLSLFGIAFYVLKKKLLRFAGRDSSQVPDKPHLGASSAPSRRSSTPRRP
jgi:hypothetical protein